MSYAPSPTQFLQAVIGDCDGYVVVPTTQAEDYAYVKHVKSDTVYRARYNKDYSPHVTNIEEVFAEKVIVYKPVPKAEKPTIRDFWYLVSEYVEYEDWYQDYKIDPRWELVHSGSVDDQQYGEESEVIIVLRDKTTETHWAVKSYYSSWDGCPWGLESRNEREIKKVVPKEKTVIYYEEVK